MLNVLFLAHTKVQPKDKGNNGDDDDWNPIQHTHTTEHVNLRQIQKQIHFFLLAFLADSTAKLVCFNLHSSVLSLML